MRLAIDKHEGEAIRWGWAVCYRDFDRECSVTYPIPLHLFVRWARDLRFWLMQVGRPGYREQVEAAAFRSGLWQDARNQERLVDVWRERTDIAREEGYRDGWKAAFNHMERDIDKLARGDL